MPYVIAAYAVALGTLTLYAVYLRAERGDLRQAAAQEPPQAVPDGNFGFNVGAALLAPVWLLAHGKGIAGGALLAAIAVAGLAGSRAVVVGVAAIAVAAGVYLGLNGNRIAARERKLRLLHRLAVDQRKWLYLGVVAAYAGYLPLLIWVLVAAAPGN